MDGDEDGRPTSRDVARAAGVSRTTVSFVLNDVPGQTISDATRAAVHAAAERLGYTPSASARALRSGRSRLVLCLAPEWDPSALMDETLTMMSRSLRDEGFAVVVAKASAMDAADVLWTAVAPAAVVAMFDLPDSARQRLRTMRVPVVDMYLSSRREGEPTDDLQIGIGRLQAEHLLRAGCDRLVSVVPSQHRVGGVVRDRVAGARAIAEEHGLPVPPVLVYDELRTSGVPAALRGAGLAGARIGICAFNDDVAVGVLALARGAGLAIPADLRVIGVDDEPVAALVVPSLTSVRLDLRALDRVVIGRLKRALRLPDCEDEPTGPFVAVVERESA